MEKQSTAYRLSFYISTAIISVFLVFIFLNYQYSRKLMRENAEHNAISLSSTLIVKTKGNVIASQEVAKNTALQVPYYALNGDIGTFLKGIIVRFPFVQSINVSLQKGAFPGGNEFFSVYRNKDGINYLEDSGLTHSARAKPPGIDSLINWKIQGWVEPYRSDFLNQVVAMYHVPVMLKSETGKNLYAGHVTVELSLSYIGREIQDVKIGKHGFAFLVSQKGTYITHPRKDWILKENLKDVSDTVYKGDRQVLYSALEKSATGNFIAYPRILNFQKSWVYFTPIQETRWILIFIMPYSELYHDLRMMLYKMVSVSLIGIVVIFFLVVYISKKVTDPLSQIINELHDFSTSGRAKTSKNEYENLERSFSLIQAWYKKFKHEQESIRKSEKQLKNELEQASEIIHNIIPDESILFPVNDEFEIYSAYKPANVIGGDLFDYFLIDDYHLLVAIGDVSGKGISAALFMSVAHTLLKSNASGKLAKNIVKEINKELSIKNQNQYFVTLFVAIVDLKSGSFNYCNAAHTTSVILKEDGSVAELNDTHGLPLGLYTNHNYSDSSAKLSEGDTLFLYSDGVTEMADKEGNLFGESLLKNKLANLKGCSPEETINSLEESLKIFREGVKQVDDYCMIALRYLPKKS